MWKKQFFFHNAINSITVSNNYQLSSDKFRRLCDYIFDYLDLASLWELEVTKYKNTKVLDRVYDIWN